MPYLLKFTKKDQELTRFAVTAVQALVLMQIYAANGFEGITAFDTVQNAEVSEEELTARARRLTD